MTYVLNQQGQLVDDGQGFGGMANWGQTQQQTPQINLSGMGGNQDWLLNSGQINPLQRGNINLSGVTGIDGASSMQFGNGGSPSDLTGWQKGQLGIGGLQALTGLWGGYNAYQANKIAKGQLAFQKEIGNANLNNQIKSYNTTLEDRATTRAQFSAADDGTGSDYYEKNKLSR